MKRNFVSAVLLALVAMFCFGSIAQAKEKKKKKEKKEFVWQLPEKMTDIKDFDEYLLTCDSLWNRITTYRDSIHFFKIDSVLVQDKETGVVYYDIQIRDENGTKRSWAQSIQQGADMIFTGTDIVLDVANISLMTVTAGASLTENPLLAFSYGKYLKAGPKIVALAYQEVREIVNRTKQQMRTMKQIHQNKVDKSTDTDYLVEVPEGTEINLEECVDLATIDLGTSAAQDLPPILDGMDLENDLEVPEEKKA